MTSVFQGRIFEFRAFFAQNSLDTHLLGKMTMSILNGEVQDHNRTIAVAIQVRIAGTLTDKSSRRQARVPQKTAVRSRT